MCVVELHLGSNTNTGLVLALLHAPGRFHPSGTPSPEGARDATHNGMPCDKGIASQTSHPSSTYLSTTSKIPILRILGPDAILRRNLWELWRLPASRNQAGNSGLQSRGLEEGAE